MKILKLKFKNINSLYGICEIDFTKPEFTDTGLFVITGKTGAGKSSILDAISLALYGKTPRVDISKESNSVMTYGTSDCYSEIVFEIEIKKWISSWKQERTDKGTLKAVNRQIADGSRKIYADQIISCNKKIEKIIGLTFEQFTKVIMLAQGSFAAFLQAKKKEKGELLEQITGTEIYGQISKKVFERHKAENHKLAFIVNALENIKTLSQDEVDNLNSEMEHLKAQKQKIDNDLQIIETAKKWLYDIENLKKQLIEAKQRVPDLEQKLENAKIKVESAETKFLAINAEKENSDNIIVKVRELDTKIVEKAKFLNNILQTITQLQKTYNNLKQTFENQTVTLNNSKNSLIQRQEWAEKNRKYELLTNQFAAIENRNSQVCNLLGDLTVKKSEFEKVNKDLLNQKKISQNAFHLFTEKEKALKNKEEELETRKNEHSTVLSGKDINVFHDDKEKITKFGLMIKELIDIEKGSCEQKSEIEKLNNSIDYLQKKEKEFVEIISNNKSKVENLKVQIELLDENIKLAQKIKDFDDHRKSLEVGKPCPLCGALEHPYALGNIPKTDEKETELKNLKKQEQEINNLILQNEKALSKMIADKENNQKNRQKAEKILVENETKLFEKLKLDTDKTLTHIFLTLDFTNRISQLNEICEQKRKELRQIILIISKATDIEKAIKALQDNEIPNLQQAKQTAYNEKNEADTKQKLNEQNLENQKKQFEEAEKKYNIENCELLKIFDNYGVTNMETLKKCFNDWNNNKKETEDLKEQIIKLEHSLALTNSEIENNHKQIEDKKIEKQGVETEKQILSRERFTIFADKRVEDEEKRLKNLYENAVNEKSNAERSKHYAVTELEKNRAIITEKEKELNEKSAKKITAKTSEELQTEYTTKKPLIDMFLLKIGANQTKLEINEENLQKNRKRLEEKELQEQICAKWGNLNKLIGSADGYAYRNFAQSLTFDHLVGLSNCQLQKMSERYVLKRDEETSNPFELSVIDKFQNCKERPTQNLSGGETFIVSLSLALGLANMASKNMKIDTMFIDEGFGTLDSEYLDTALSALSTLQNEGKLIGVISHLTELKERIATHIEVIPKGNGYSRIETKK